MISVSKKAYIITIIFLIVVILGLGGYIVYDKFFDVKENDIKENQGSLEDVRKKQEENKVDVEKLGKELFEMTKDAWGGDYYYYFYPDNISLNNNNTTNDKKYYNNMFNESRIITAFNSSTDVKKYDNVRDCLGFEKEFLVSSVSKNSLEDSYHKIFGSDKEVIFENDREFESSTEKNYFSKDAMTACRLENDMFNCYRLEGGDMNGFRSLIKYYKTEKNNDELYVYSKVVSTNLTYNYKGFSESEVIGSNKVELFDRAYENIENNWSELVDKAATYKLTFKKDTNDNYYWVSTELVK